MRQLLLGLCVAESFGACMLGVPSGPPQGDFGKPPTNYQAKIRAYVARHYGEGAKIDFNQAPTQMWAEKPSIELYGVRNWHGYEVIFDVTTHGSRDSQQMYADFRDDVIVGLGPYTPPLDPPN